MPVGTTLVNLRKMFKAEVGEEIDETISPGNVTALNQKLSNQQRFLVNQHTFLNRKVRAEVALTAGTQYYALPTGIDMDRLEYPVFVNFSGYRYAVEHGIGQREYNVWDSSQGVRGQPVYRWDLVDVAGVRKIEVWPLPESAMTLLFSGLMAITDLTLDADLCVIDDLLLVLFTAAEELARSGSGDAQAKLAKAQAYLNSLKASAPTRFEMVNISGGARNVRMNSDWRRPVVGTS